MEELSIEIIHRIVYGWLDKAEDVLALAMTSKAMYRMVLGEPGSEDEYDVDQHRALMGVAFCVKKGWWRAARLAMARGYGDPEEEIQVSWGDGVGVGVVWGGLSSVIPAGQAANLERIWQSTSSGE